MVPFNTQNLKKNYFKQPQTRPKDVGRKRTTNFRSLF